VDDSARFVVTTAAAIPLAGVGYFAKYRNDLEIARRKDRLDRVNRQLSELYGPLYAHLSASDAAIALTESWGFAGSSITPGGKWLCKHGRSE
jgi:hypothetical protein